MGLHVVVCFLGQQPIDEKIKKVNLTLWPRMCLTTFQCFEQASSYVIQLRYANDDVLCLPFCFHFIFVINTMFYFLEANVRYPYMAITESFAIEVAMTQNSNGKAHLS